MERKEKHGQADTAVITPLELQSAIPPMGELINDLFAGFAPLARRISADAKDGRASSC